MSQKQERWMKESLRPQLDIIGVKESQPGSKPSFKANSETLMFPSKLKSKLKAIQ